MSGRGEAEAPLRGIRVLECGGTVAGAYAGRLLADLGAEVVTAQPEGGDRVWRRGPALAARGDRDGAGHGDRDGPGHGDRDGSGAIGAVGAYLHAGKRPAIVGADDADASAALHALAASADIVIADLDGGIVDAAWATRLASEHPRLVV